MERIFRSTGRIVRSIPDGENFPVDRLDCEGWWLSGRVLAAQARGVLGSTAGFFRFPLFSSHNIFSLVKVKIIPNLMKASKVHTININGCVTSCQPSQSSTVLSRASAHFRASAYPPILTVLSFFEILRVTAHHAKLLHNKSKVGSLSSHT